MTLVLAIGGNALMVRGEAPDVDVQRRRVVVVAESLAGAADGRPLVVTHGNGPQVGLLAIAEAGSDGVLASSGMDVFTAQTEGWMGYLLEGALSPLRAGPVVTVVTRVEVDPADPALATPTKPVGPVYRHDTGDALAARYGWSMRPDGDGLRGVVASPEPVRVLSFDAIRLLVDHGFTVVAGGGGGVPVTTSGGFSSGVDAVIDKDLTSASLAIDLEAATLALLTDVDAVYRGWGSATAQPIRRASVRELAPFRRDDGAMGPKVEAACRFASATGCAAVIASVSDAAAALRGETGTTVVP
jgi:carbamate kinase